MKANVAVLADALCRNWTVSWKSAAGHAMTLNGTRLLTHSPYEKAGEKDRSLLWVCDKASAPLLASQEVPVAVACEQGDDAEAVAEELFERSGGHGEVLVADMAGGTSELLNALLAAWDRLDAWDARLSDAIALRKPLSKVLDAGAQMLANPVAVFDEESCLLSYSGDMADGYEETIWTDVLDKGRAPVSYYSNDERRKITATINDSVEPTIVRPARSPKHENLSVSIFEGNQFLGTVAQVDLVEPFDCAQVSLVMHLRDRLVSYFHTTVAGRHHRSPIGHTLRQLIEGTEVEPRGSLPAWAQGVEGG